MKKWITAAAVLVFASSFALAQESGGQQQRRGPRGQQSFTEMYGEKLALTDAQKTQIAGIEKGTREKNAEFFESSRQLMAEVRAAREANDAAKLDALKPKVEANREQMGKIREGERKEIVALLTADQKAQYDKLEADRKARMEEHKQQ